MINRFNKKDVPMFKPHVTVACIVHAEDKFLVVEETINGKSLAGPTCRTLEAR